MVQGEGTEHGQWLRALPPGQRTRGGSEWMRGKVGYAHSQFLTMDARQGIARREGQKGGSRTWQRNSGCLIVIQIKKKKIGIIKMAFFRGKYISHLCIICKLMLGIFITIC